MPPRDRSEEGLTIDGVWYSNSYLEQLAEQFNDPEIRERVAQVEAYLKHTEAKARKATKKRLTSKAVRPDKRTRFDLILDEEGIEQRDQLLGQMAEAVATVHRKKVAAKKARKKY